jgi:hypothetical protein
MLDELAVGDPPDVDVAHGEPPSGRLTADERAGMPPAHGDALADLVALRELVFDGERGLAEGAVKPLDGAPYARGPGRPFAVCRLVVDEVGMNELRGGSTSPRA